eukprot:1138052-Pelagomonas_calceolata.AAC.1
MSKRQEGMRAGDSRHSITSQARPFSSWSPPSQPHLVLVLHALGTLQQHPARPLDPTLQDQRLKAAPLLARTHDGHKAAAGQTHRQSALRGWVAH